MGLWWLAEDVRDLLGPDQAEEHVASETLRAPEPLLEARAMMPCDLRGPGYFVPWVGSPEEHAGRILDAWKKLDEPDIGDIVWFVRGDAGLARPRARRGSVSEGKASRTELSQVYVRLLGEGTLVFRPAPAELIRAGLAKLAAPPGYDPDDEDWEFAPGSIVRVEVRPLGGANVLVAVALAD